MSGEPVRYIKDISFFSSSSSALNCSNMSLIVALVTRKNEGNQTRECTFHFAVMQRDPVAIFVQGGPSRRVLLSQCWSEQGFLQDSEAYISIHQDTGISHRCKHSCKFQLVSHRVQVSKGDAMNEVGERHDDVN